MVAGWRGIQISCLLRLHGSRASRIQRAQAKARCCVLSPYAPRVRAHVRRCASRKIAPGRDFGVRAERLRSRRRACRVGPQIVGALDPIQWGSSKVSIEAGGLRYPTSYYWLVITLPAFESSSRTAEVLARQLHNSLQQLARKIPTQQGPMNRLVCALVTFLL